MPELGTTNINDLPTNPKVAEQHQQAEQMASVNIPHETNGNMPPMNVNTNLGLDKDQNIKIGNYGQHLNEQMQQKKPLEVDFTNKLSSALQDASITGATDLPPRDIPQDTLPRQQDEQVAPDFIPDSQRDYIGNIIDNEKIISEAQIKQNKVDNAEYIYEQLQMPLLVSVIYFLFQIPLFKTYTFRLMPKLFKPDGNANIYGYVFNSVIFGLTYYVLTKIISHINNL